jgi:hypothetical protein
MMLILGLALLALTGTAPLWVEKFTARNNLGALNMSFRYGVVLFLAAVVAGEWILSGQLSSGWMATVNAAAFISFGFLNRV